MVNSSSRQVDSGPDRTPGFESFECTTQDWNDERYPLDSAVVISLTSVKILFCRVSQSARRTRFVVVKSIIFEIVCKLRARVTIVEGSSIAKF